MTRMELNGNTSITGSFSLFSIVKFGNDECTTEISPDIKGICRSAEDCSAVGGIADGKCASGFGVCCRKV